MLSARWAAAQMIALDAFLPAPFPVSPSVPLECASTARTFQPHIAHSLRWWPGRSVSAAELNARKNGGPKGIFKPESSVSIRNRSMFVRTHGEGYKERPSSMLHVLSRAVLPASMGGHLPDDAPPPPDVDLFLVSLDGPPGPVAPPINGCRGMPCADGVPILSTVELSRQGASSTWSSAGDFGEQKMDYGEIYRAILRESNATAYTTRVKRVLFRGGLNDFDRAKAIPTFAEHADLFDAGLRSEPPPTEAPMQSSSLNHMPLANFSHFAANLYMAGNGYSSRLKYLLLAGSPVLYLLSDRGEQREFYTAALMPYKHFIFVTSKTLPAVAAWILANPEIGASIGAAGAAFAREHLSPKAVTCWWRVLLSEYEKILMKDAAASDPRSDPDFVQVPSATLAFFLDLTHDEKYGKRGAQRKERDALSAAAAA